jgi:hypothetical protein
LPADKHTGILTEIQTKVKKKMAKKELFLVTLSAVERVYHKKAPFLVIQIRSTLSFSIVANISKLSPQYKTFFVIHYLRQ